MKVIRMLKQVYSQYVINFEKKDDLVDYISLFKSELEPFFNKNAYTIIGLPDSVQVPPELLRIQAISSNGHASLEVSLMQIRLNIRFDENYWNDFPKCYQYMKQRIIVLDSLAKKLTNGKIFFNGIVTHFIDDDIENPTSHILNHLYRPGVNQNKVFDVLSKLTYVKDDLYYINAMVNNERKDARHASLGIQLDINSRYFSNYNTDNKYANDSIIRGTIELYNEVVTDHLEEIEKGELSLC